MTQFQKFTIRIDNNTFDKIKNICDATGKNTADTVRDLIKKGLASEWSDENIDLISHIVRQQLEAVMKPHVERLAALESKTGHAAATAMFLNVQSFMDLVPAEKRKLPKEMYEKARKKSVEYMRTPLDKWKEEEV